MRGVWITFLCSVLLLAGLHWTIQTKYLFIADSLLKVIQGKSLLENGFTSEELISSTTYLNSSWDAYLYQNDFVQKVKGKWIGQYPVFLSVFTAILLAIQIPPEVFPFINAVLFLLGFLYLSIAFQNKDLLFLFFLSMPVYLTLEYSESGLFFLFCALSTKHWIHFLENKKGKDLTLLCFWASIGVWLRLELIFFLAAAGISSLVMGFINRKEIPKLLVYGLLGSIPLCFFLIWNQSIYGHLLGPRYFFNFNKDPFSLSKELFKFTKLVFFGYENAPKIGFVAANSIFIWIWFRYRSEPISAQNKKFIQVVAFCFLISLILVGIFAPNDGITISARYHIICLPQLLFLWSKTNDSFSDLFKKKGFLVLFGFAFLLNLFVLKVFRSAAKHEKKYQTMVYGNPADLYLVTNPILCGESGLLFLEKEILCLHKETNINRLVAEMERNWKGKTLYLIGDEETRTSVFLNSSNQWLSILKRTNLAPALEKLELERKQD